MTHKDDSAFPVPPPVMRPDGDWIYVNDCGLTKREYFAAQLMLGQMNKGIGDTNAAHWAVIAADVLIKALNGGNDGA